MDKSQAKKLFKAVALLYVVSFLVINWNDISWIFNYKAVKGALDDFFNPYPGIQASAMDAYFYPNHSKEEIAVAKQNSNNVEIKEIKEIKTNYTDKQNTLEIPKIGISFSIAFTRKGICVFFSFLSREMIVFC